MDEVMEYKERNIYSLLESIEKRPGMFIQNESLQELSLLIWGYYSALHIHNLFENVPSMDRHFMGWLRYRTDWSCCAGWAFEIEQSVAEDEKPIDLFFFFVKEYRKLIPKLRSVVKLSPQHNPTGKRRTTGDLKLMEKPISIEIFQYDPEPLHFLKFIYEDKVDIKDELLESRIGKFETSIKNAKSWARDEFQVKFDEWQDVKN